MLIDGLQCGHFSRESFAGLLKGGVGAVTVTCGFWETPTETMDIFVKWREMARENADIVGIALSTDDIRSIHADGRLAVILGAQNTDLLGGRIGYVELFADMGLRVMQLTYNTQNSVGSSCYEPVDTGLTKFGRELVLEMGRAGVLVDLSHVGDKTSLDAIQVSEKPVAITHANPKRLFDHKRNKSDDVLKALAERGGVLGCATYRNITGDAYCASAVAWGEMVARTVDMIGIDHVAIGTDRSHNHVTADYLWMRKGRWTRTGGYGAGVTTTPVKVEPPAFFRDLEQIAVLPEGLRAAGFNESEVTKITHGNWLRLYGEVFSGTQLLARAEADRMSVAAE